MIVQAWLKLGTDVEHLLRHLNYRCYDSLVIHRYRIASALAATQRMIAPPDSDFVQMARVNRWIARSRVGEDVAGEVGAWDVGPLAQRYRIAKCALLDDFDALATEIPLALQTTELTREALRIWPLFQPLREQPLFAELLSSGSN